MTTRDESTGASLKKGWKKMKLEPGTSFAMIGYHGSEPSPDEHEAVRTVQSTKSLPRYLRRGLILLLAG